MHIQKRSPPDAEIQHKIGFRSSGANNATNAFLDSLPHAKKFHLGVKSIIHHHEDSQERRVRQGFAKLYWTGKVVVWMAKRTWGLKRMNRLVFAPAKGTKIDGFVNEEIQVASSTTPGHSIRVRVHKPKNTSGPLPAVLYVHGGGYQVGVPEQAHDFFADVMKKRNVAVIAPAYRLSIASKSPLSHGLNDCYDTVRLPNSVFWIAGHSGGGGLATALTLKVIDTKIVDLSFIMPIYPMLDHRMKMESASDFAGNLVWDHETNAGAWDRSLGHLSPEEITDYASPALRRDVSNLPPTISFVGPLEPFRDKVIVFMEALKESGVPTKFRIYEGAFHGFEVADATQPIAIDANNFQINAFAEFYDECLT